MSRPGRFIAAALVGVALAFAAPAAGAEPVQPQVSCTDSTDDALRLDMQVLAGDTGQWEPAFGYYAVPSTPPKGLVVFAHGHGNSAWKWRDNLRIEAEQLGVIAVAMDNRRQTFPNGDITQTSFGWRVREGAEDSIAAAKLFDQQCLSRRAPIVMYGVSMGGNTSGLAVAAKAKRLDGSPLFDYWFDIEGVNNEIETYLAARAIAGPPLENATGKTAVAEMHDEMGGPIEQHPDAYVDDAVVAHAADIGASGLKGVVIVHGADDGTVNYNQSPEMFALLAAQGIPTDFFTVGRHGDATKGNTIEDTAGIPSRVPGYSSPFTGHGGENDRNHAVIRVGFDRLAALFENGDAPRCFRVFAVDWPTIVPDPATFRVPSCAARPARARRAGTGAP